MAICQGPTWECGGVGFIGSLVAVEENLFVGGGAGNELAMQVSSVPRVCEGAEHSSAWKYVGWRLVARVFDDSLG